MACIKRAKKGGMGDIDLDAILSYVNKKKEDDGLSTEEWIVLLEDIIDGKLRDC